MSDEALVEPPPLPDSPRFAGPMPCLKCLYDLATLTADQRCPECGTEVARTLASPAAASAAELKRLRKGLLLIVVPMIGGTLWLLLAQFSIMWFAFAAIGAGVSSLVMDVLLYAVPFVSAVFCMLSAFGWSRAMKSAAVLIPGRAKRARTVMRLAWWYAILMSTVLLGSVMLETVGFGGMESAVVAMGLSVATLLVWNVRTLLGFGLLAHMATDCCAPKTALLMNILRWAAAALSAIVASLATMGEFLRYELYGVLPLDFLLAIAGLGLVAAIITLGASATLLRRRLAPFAQEAMKREQNAVAH